MYKDDKKNIGWLKIFVRVVILFLIFMLVVKLISMGVSKFHSNEESNFMKDNLKVMDKAAKEYFKDDELPSKLGKSNKVTLKELIDKELIEELKDDRGNTCSVDTSFIQATKLDTEYQIKSYLECGDESDYSNNYIKIEDDNQTIKPTTTTSTTKKVQVNTTTKNNNSTVKKTTTTKKKTTLTTTSRVTVKLYYKVDFNTNGGKALQSQYFKPGSQMIKIIPTREGYKFIGWYYNGKEFDFNTKINKDYVLVAKWAKE